MITIKEFLDIYYSNRFSIYSRYNKKLEEFKYSNMCILHVSFNYNKDKRIIKIANIYKDNGVYIPYRQHGLRSNLCYYDEYLNKK